MLLPYRMYQNLTGSKAAVAPLPSRPRKSFLPVRSCRAAVAGLMLLASLLAACSGNSNNAPAPPAPGVQAPPSAVASQTAALALGGGGTATPAAPGATTSVTVGTATTTSTPSDATTRAIMAVIQRANTEQQQALAQNDPTVMQDTATPGYFRVLVQTQRDMQTGGVSAIKLLNLQWGPISVQGNSAQATTIETWQTSFADGTSAQSTDRNVYTLVQQGGAWLIAADAHPDTQLNQPGPGPSGPSSLPTAPSGPPGASQSRNWAGYAASGSQFTAVSGTWTVPQVNAGGSAGGADATWVGIGGVTSTDLVQAGTQAEVTGPGQVSYGAWIETLPQPAQTVPLTVNPGDTITVSLTQQASGSWQISIQDKTTGQNFQTTVLYNSSQSSAEWIEEAPAAASVGLRIVTLDDFGQVQFQNGTATEGGRQVTIAQAGGQPITMYGRGGQPLAQPSPLGSDGSSFTVTRVGSGPVTSP